MLYFSLWCICIYPSVRVYVDTVCEPLVICDLQWTSAVPQDRNMLV